MSFVPLPNAATGHDQPGRDHRGEPVGRLQRQVHAADEQDQALADHDDAERGDLLADAGDVRDRQERGVQDRADDESTTSTGSSAASRIQRDRRGAAGCRLRASADSTSAGQDAPSCWSVGCRSCALPVPSVAAISASRSKGGSVNSVKTSPRTSTTTRSQMTRSASSSLASSRLAPVSVVTRSSSDEQQFLGRHVHAAGRRDRHDQHRVAGQGPGHGHLLLVAAGQLADRLAEPGRHQGQPRGPAARPRASRRRGLTKPNRGEPVGDRHRDVLGHAEQRHEPVRLPVLGDVADARAQRAGPVARPQRVITAAGPAPPSGASRRPRSGPGWSPPPAQPGDAHPLAAPHGQRDVAQEHARRGRTSRPRRPGRGRPPQRSAAGGARGGPGAGATAAVRQKGFAAPTIAVTRSSLVSLGERRGQHQLAVAQHGDVLADLEDLLQVVGDVQDRDAAAA